LGNSNGRKLNRKIKLVKEKIKKIIYLIGSIIIRKKKYVIKENEIKKILFIQLNFRGDLLFNTPLFEILKIVFPKSDIDVWIKSRSKDILFNNPNIKKIHIFDHIKTEDYTDKTKINFKRKIKFLNGIRKEKYDFVFDFTGIISTALFTLFSGTKLSFGKNSQGFGFCYNEFDDTNTFKTNEHLIVKYKNILKTALHIENNEWTKINKIVESRPKVYISDAIKIKIDKVFAKRKISAEKKMICLHLTSGWEEKRWSEIKYKELIRALFDKYECEIIFIGDSFDEYLYKKIKESIGEFYSYRLNERFFSFNLVENAEVIRRVNLFIGGDSGPLQLAFAVNTPTIAIFGPTNPLFSNPIGDNNYFVYKRLTCSANEDEQYCTKNAGRKCETIECLKIIEISDILYLINKNKMI
jgi:ADP-heptose:LPS heptosyltransferase